MLFERRLRDGIHDDQITVACRRWVRAQVKPGGRYRTGLDLIEMDRLEMTSAEQLSASDGCLAGCATVDNPRADLRHDVSVPVYRLVFHQLPGPYPTVGTASPGGNSR